MATTEGYLYPAVAAGAEYEAVTLTEPDRRAEHDTFTPTLTATGGTPAIGADGFLTAWWYRTGRVVDVWYDICLSGAGVSIVGTSWRLSLPLDVDTTRHTTGVLNAASDCIGVGGTQSSTSTDGRVLFVLCSGTAELIMYPNGSTSSLGSGNFTTQARIKLHIRYLADAAEF